MTSIFNSYFGDCLETNHVSITPGLTPRKTTYHVTSVQGRLHLDRSEKAVTK